MAPSFSRAESLRRYFLTLQVGDRHDLMTVRDVRAVGSVRDSHWNADPSYRRNCGMEFGSEL